MKISELAHRYAKAVYELAVENRTQDKVFGDLRALENALEQDHAIPSFLSNPMVSADDRVAVLNKAFEGNSISKEATDLILLLARNDRFGIFKEVVHAFEAQADEANGVCRGVVRSATVLDQAEREKIESTVEVALKKKVIMQYKVDPTVIGGLVAQVGSYTFDDSIAFHLRRMNEELNRRTV